MANVYSPRSFLTVLNNLNKEMVLLFAHALKSLEEANAAYMADDYPKGLLAEQEKNLRLANEMKKVLQNLNDLAEGYQLIVPVKRTK